MNPSTRVRLRQAWGFCQRHSWGWMVVEAAFRNSYMHGPAILFEDLMVSAARHHEIRGPVQFGRLARRLKAKGPCLMCQEGYGPVSNEFVKPNIIQQGRDLTQFRLMALRTRPFWRKAVCGSCSNTDSAMRCRIHLIEDISKGRSVDVQFHRSSVEQIVDHIGRYERSFQFDFQNTRTDEDEAALIAAVGWCCGLETLLSLLRYSEDASSPNTIHTDVSLRPAKKLS